MQKRAAAFFWLITLMVPLALLFLGIRVQLTHVFLNLEYHSPGFPEDPNGLPDSDRIKYADITLDYLLNKADISFLSDRRFPSGVKLFNSRELKHMEDVKKLVRPMLWIGYGIWSFLLIVSLWAFLQKQRPELQKAMHRGGWLAIGLAAAIMVIALISFRQLFILFHMLFFEENSWRFFPDNTLIRLFPLRFWRDSFLILCFISICGGVGLVLGTRKNKV
jgi:integral membrane protein (TIGR01906 family)